MQSTAHLAAEMFDLLAVAPWTHRAGVILVVDLVVQFQIRGIAVHDHGAAGPPAGQLGSRRPRLPLVRTVGPVADVGGGHRETGLGRHRP